MERPGGGGVVPGGGIPHRQEIGRSDADVEATSVADLQALAADDSGRTVWVPDDATLDFTGDDLHVQNGVIASGRTDGHSGGTIVTDDQGASSPTWDGGSNDRGLITLGDNARLTGLQILGPHHSEQDHPAIPGYIPFAPQDSRSARESWREERYARGVTILGDNVTVDNCEIAYFSVQGISVGSTGHTPENTVISFCHIHNSMLTSLGYAIDIRHGHPRIHNCYFDATRHSINGSGMADAGYYVTDSTFGPWTASHPIDMHGVSDNVSGSSDPSARDYRHRAGGTMVVEGCTIMPYRIPDLPFVNHRPGGQTPHVHVRAVPEDIFHFDNNICSHASPDEGINQSGIPSDYSTDENGWHNIHVGSGNQWGVDFDAMNNVP